MMLHHYVRCLSDAGYFEAVAFTSEDRHRAELYAANAEREPCSDLRKLWTTFFAGLKCRSCAALSPPLITPGSSSSSIRPINLMRQPGDTPPKRSPILPDCPNVLTLQFRLLDRIGDNGLVSAMILRPTAEEENVLEIDNWVMSCRVFGRRLEFEAMNIAVEAARQLGIKGFVADYIATSKNNVISALYPSLGFAAVSEPEISNGATRWFLNLADYVTHQSHIARAGVGA